MCIAFSHHIVAMGYSSNRKLTVTSGMWQELETVDIQVNNLGNILL